MTAISTNEKNLRVEELQTKLSELATLAIAAKNFNNAGGIA